MYVYINKLCMYISINYICILINYIFFHIRIFQIFTLTYFSIKILICEMKQTKNIINALDFSNA